MIYITKNQTPSLFLHALCRWGLIQRPPKHHESFHQHPTGFGSSFWLQHQQKLGVLSSGGSSHLYPSPGAIPAPKQPQHCSGAATLPRYLWISSSTSYRGLPLRTLFIISESGDDSSPLSDSIGNPCLTSLSDKPGSQPRGPLRAFEVPERKKKKKRTSNGEGCKPRQNLTARCETKNGKLDTEKLLLSSLQSSGNETSKIDSCGKPDWWFSLMGWGTQGQMWKMLFKWLADTDEF